MKRLFKNMDALKAMILLGLVAAAGLGGWYWTLTKRFEDVKKAWKQANKDYPRIIAELKRIKVLYEESKLPEVTWGSNTYFQSQLTDRAKIPSNDYEIPQDKVKTVTHRTAKDKTMKADERVQEIRIEGRDKYFTRDQIFAAIYNSEAKSRKWRLRQLSITAREQKDRRAREQGLPETLSDEWSIDKLVFAAREPAAKK